MRLLRARFFVERALGGCEMSVMNIYIRLRRDGSREGVPLAASL